MTVRPAANNVVVGENVSVEVTDQYDDVVPDAAVSLNGESVGVTDQQGEITVPIRTEGEQSIRVETGAASKTITVTGVAISTPQPTTTETGDDDDTSSGFGPGFGPLVAIVALLAVALLARRRQ